MSGWHYRALGQDLGPVSASEIRRLAAAGRIGPDTQIKKVGTSDWILACRVKGLFGSTPPPALAAEDDGPNGLISAAGNLLSNVRSMVPARRVKVEDDDVVDVADIIETMPVASPLIQRLAQHDQDIAVVGRILDRVNEILTTNEEVRYIAVQAKPVVNLFPDCAVLTNRRFIVYRPKMLGRVDFRDFIWRELREVQLQENMIGATISFLTTGGESVTLDYLPKSQARQLYRIAQEQEEAMLEERRHRMMEEKRAGTSSIVVQTANLPSPAPSAAPQVDPVQKLQQLKQMLDAGLIAQSEYDAKKADILRSM